MSALFPQVNLPNPLYALITYVFLIYDVAPGILDILYLFVLLSN